METGSGNSSAHRICHVNLAAGYRGGERQTELLIRELGAREWPQRLVVRSGSALTLRCRAIPRLQITEVAPNPLSAAIAARGCALVHAHEARAVYSGWFLKRGSGTPYLLTRRLHHAANQSYARACAYRASNCVVAISASIAESVEAKHAELKCRIVHDAHAGMLNGHPVCREVLAGRGAKTIVGHVGELDHSHKGQGAIIEAAMALEASHPELHFVLVGEGRDGGEFRRAAEGLGNVEFVGFVENVEDYLAAFDVFVYPSLHEGLGSSLLDAMAFGLPIVASDVGGIPEIVEDGVNGLLIPPDRPNELVQALERLLNDGSMRSSMSRENRHKAARFDVGRMTGAYEEIYRSILAGDRRT